LKKKDEESGNKFKKSKSRDSKVRAVNAIKEGRQDGELEIFARSCAEGKCELCGIKIKFDYKCPLLYNDTYTIKLKQYRETLKNNTDRKQIELIEVNMTAKELMETIEAKAVPVMKHLWGNWWGSHMRRFDYFTFETGTVLYKSDFSATFDIIPQHKVNSAIAEHAIQNGIIISINPVFREVKNKNGTTSMKRFVTNIGIHIYIYIHVLTYIYI
jgi:hypothetical protein